MDAQLKILILEDNPLDAEMIQREFRRENLAYTCRLASNRQAFLRELEQFEPDLIISDHSLPQFNSYQALELARGKSPGIPFVLVTGTVSEEFAVDIIKHGADDYVLKDRMTRLPAAISAVMRQRQIEQEKKIAAKQLEESEEKYRSMMERVSDGFVAIDRHWSYTYVNKQAAEIMNRPALSLLGKNIWEEFPEGIGERIHSAYHRAMETQQYIHLEEYYSPFDRWLENHIYPSPDGLSVFFRDITERKKAERKIIQSEENLKAIFDNTSEAFILLDENCIIKAFNNRAAKSVLINTDQPTEIGKSVFDYVKADRREFFQVVTRRVLKGETLNYDRSYYSPGGGLSWISFNYNPVWNNGAVKGICITGIDISEKKIAEQRKEFDHNNVQALINNTDDLLWSIDTEFNLITSNAAFDEATQNITGTKPVRGSNILQASYSEEQSKKFRQHYEQAFLGKKFTVVEHNLHPVEFWSEISFHPIYEKDIVIGTACLAHDITERKKAEAALLALQEEQLKSKMEAQKKITLAMLQAQEKERISIGIELHDNVNQILVGSNLLLSLVKDHPEKANEFVENVMANIKDAIEENRKIAHVFVAPDLKTETLADLIEKLADKMLNPAGIKTEISTDNFNDVLLTDDRKINAYRIAQEQCTNIIKYSKATKVEISMATYDHAFHMLIKDNGIGTDTSAKVNGIGIRNINDRLSLFNGHCGIESAPGQGFALRIVIPL